MRNSFVYLQKLLLNMYPHSANYTLEISKKRSTFLFRQNELNICTPYLILQSPYYPWHHWKNQKCDTILENKNKIDQNPQKMGYIKFV